MTRKEGTLRMQPNDRWAIACSDGAWIELTSGEVFHVEVAGRDGLQATRMEHNGRAYYSIDGYPLANGLRAAIGDD